MRRSPSAWLLLTALCALAPVRVVSLLENARSAADEGCMERRRDPRWTAEPARPRRGGRDRSTELSRARRRFRRGARRSLRGGPASSARGDDAARCLDRLVLASAVAVPRRVVTTRADGDRRPRVPLDCRSGRSRSGLPASSSSTAAGRSPPTPQAGPPRSSNACGQSKGFASPTRSSRRARSASPWRSSAARSWRWPWPACPRQRQHRPRR